MISYRQKGLLNLYAAAATVLMALFFLGSVFLTRFVPYLTVSPDVNLVTFLMAVVMGTLLGMRFLGVLAPRFHELRWPDAASLAMRQIVTVALMLFTLIVATKDRSMSRLFLAHFLVMGWVFLVLMNRRLPGLLARVAFTRLHQMPTLFVGRLPTLAGLQRWIAAKRHLGLHPVGFISDEGGQAGAGGDASLMGGERLGGLDDLERLIEARKVSQVILMDIPHDPARTTAVLEACQKAGCRLLIFDNLVERFPVPVIPVSEDGHHFLSLRLEPLEDPFNRALKRAFDVAIALPVVLVVLPPLCLVVWLVQRFQAPGPLFFVRPRGGQLRSEFQMLKFRSMYHDPAADAGRVAVQARQGDSRVFPFGRFLRKSSLDEIPQFINALVGEMSIVGPRPHLSTHDYEFSRVAMAYRTRHLVKPGITGLAQVRGFRGEIKDPELLNRRVGYDIEYITRWSVWLDVSIVLRTVLIVFRPPGEAY